MKRSIMSLEEMVPEQVEAPVSGEVLQARVEANMGRLNAAQSELSEKASEISEAQDIHTAVDSLTEKLEERLNSSTDEQGFSDTNVEALEIAVEHFRTRLGFGKKVIPALEAFQVEGMRKSVSLEALANLKELSARTGAVIAIAQENMGEALNERIVDGESGNKQILSQLRSAEKNYHANGAVEGAISGGRWSRSLGNFSQEPVKGSEIAKRVKSVADLYADIDGAKIVAEMTRTCEALLLSLKEERKSPSGTSDVVSRFKRLENLSDSLSEILHKKTKQSEVSEFLPAEKSDVSSLVGSVEELVKEMDAFYKEWQKFTAAVAEVNGFVSKVKASRGNESSIIGRIAGFFGGQIVIPIPLVGAIVGYYVGKHIDKRVMEAERVKNARTAQHSDRAMSASEAVATLSDYDFEGLSICSSAVGYIVASTK